MMQKEVKKRARFRRGLRSVMFSVRAKINLLFLGLLLAYVFLVVILCWRVLAANALTQARQSSEQSADLIISGVRETIENTQNISYNLLLHADIDTWTREGATHTPASNRSATQALMQAIVTYTNIESIYFFDLYGNELRVVRNLVYPSFTHITEASWYHRAVELDGYFFVSINADDTLIPSTGLNTISLIRQMLDINTMQPIGFLIINLHEGFLSSLTDQLTQKYGTEIYIVDENGSSVLGNTKISPDLLNISPEGELRTVNQQENYYFSTEIPDLGWKVICVSRHSVFDSFRSAALLLLIPSICAIGMFCFGLYYTSTLISRPMREMIVAMREVRSGKFQPMPKNHRRDEFGQMRHTFNRMVTNLNTLTRQREKDARERRKYELDILVEQIKPHFLYNTLSTISYLIMKAENQRAGEAVNALSNFYRISLNHGSETVPLSEEIKMVKNYLSLQRLRYGELLNDQYEITPEADEVQVLRNILQPLVENSIYHGIKPSGEPGTITIRARCEDEFLLLSVEDDGMGMSPEQLADIDNYTIELKTKSFGLRGTLKRLKLYYGKEDIYEIESRQTVGTRILLKIPIRKEEGVQ